MNSSFKSWFQCKWNKSFWKRQYGDDEWFDVLSPNGRILGQAPRTVCHEGPFLLHPVVHLHLFDSKGRLYLQRRSWSKSIQPGKWDTAVGGHVDAGEGVSEALIRESREELNIEGFKPVFLKKYIWEYPIEAEQVHSFWTRWDREVITDPQEIEEGRFWDLSLLQEEMNSGEFTPNFLWEWRNVLKPAILEGHISGVSV